MGTRARTLGAEHPLTLVSESELALSLSTQEKFDEAADAKRAAHVEHWAEERSKGLYATSRISDDGMIDPRDTRAVIAMALSACANAEVKGTKEFGTWRM